MVFQCVKISGKSETERFSVLLDFENLGKTCIYFKLLILSDLKEIECKLNTE